MTIVVAILRQIHVFLLGFAISAACLMSAGLLAAYPNGAPTEVAIDDDGAFQIAVED
ncbi:hypothetical protein [uncultured Litoreibacter sp.]|uniref:hypothetical protein n=1 Tax=uncultured Litoreibacter sp. TaxID=1392394 RepID=UPI002625F525|nr:hypothetical protein [uncultured Litoreibacter sp.]